MGFSLWTPRADPTCLPPLHASLNSPGNEKEKLQAFPLAYYILKQKHIFANPLVDEVVTGEAPHFHSNIQMTKTRL